MTTVKMREVFQRYFDYILGYAGYENIVPDELPSWLYDAPARNIDEYKLLCHLAWMCERCLKVFIPLAEKGGTGDEKEKALVWLGYVQGELRAAGHFCVTDLRNHNRATKVSP